MTYTYNVENFRTIFEQEATWLNGFMRNVRRFSKKAAMRCGTQSWTYNQLNEDANRLANALLQDGLCKNAVLMFMLFNSPEFILSYLAGHKTGAVNCPVNYRMSAGELAYLLEDSQPEFLLYDVYFSEVLDEALKRSGHKPRRILAVGAQSGFRQDIEAFSAYMSSGSKDNPCLNEVPSIYDETIRLYTSGTTNRAKGVPINSINELFSAHDVIMHYPLSPEDRTLNLTPWFHRGGIHIGGPTPTLYAGGEVVILKEFKPRSALELIAEEEVNFITGVPSIFRLLARAQKTQPKKLPKLKGLCSMGSPFSKAEILEYKELFTPNILNGYGTTETCVNSYLRPYSPLEKCASTGQACIDDEVRLVRMSANKHSEPEDIVARDNKEIGEIIIKAPFKNVGTYYRNEEMSKNKFYKNYHYTGDIGVWDEDGFITVLSRKDDMIISAGENIYPAQIEAVLNEHPKVSESAVIGVADKAHGQLPVAYIVRADESLTSNELKAWCNQHPMLSEYKRPRAYYIVENLPHTATGKLMHYKLRYSASEERLESALTDCPE